MSKQNFDEYQIIKRQRIAFETLFITFVLVFLNGWITSSYLWAPPMIQALIVVIFPTMYFVTRAVFKNAYLSNKVKHPLSNTAFFVGLGVVNLIVAFSAYRNLGVKHFFDHGRLTANISPIILAIFFIHIGTMILIKHLTERRSADH